jgi:hypothetical protein
LGGAVGSGFGLSGAGLSLGCFEIGFGFTRSPGALRSQRRTGRHDESGAGHEDEQSEVPDLVAP